MLKPKHFFLLPALATLVAIIIFPLVFTFRVSFSSWDVYQAGLDYIGGRNYLRVFEDARFWESLLRLSALSFITVTLQYVNRLSDLLFVIARALNQGAGKPDVLWNRDQQGKADSNDS